MTRYTQYYSHSVDGPRHTYCSVCTHTILAAKTKLKMLWFGTVFFFYKKKKIFLFVFEF